MSITIKENVLLAPYTTFKVGGPARFFADVGNLDELREAIQFARSKNLPSFILGGGSNILISDAGFPGLVLRNKFSDFDTEESRDYLRVKVGGGEDWDKFVEFAISKNAAGIECLSGIPGTVGAAPVQNIGAYGQSVSETIESVAAIDLASGREEVFNNESCQFGYRTSRFKKDSGKYFITSVTFRLKKGAAPAIFYHELKNYFAGVPAPSLAEARHAVIKIRSKKGMVVTGAELETSVGSFFTNPVLGRGFLNDLKTKVEECERLKNCCRPPWFWEWEGERIKISAACLIECAGFPRGIKRGRVGISPLHSLAVVNLGGAAAQEIMFFAEDIRNKVKKEFGINLEIEPQLIGNFIYN